MATFVRLRPPGHLQIEFTIVLSPCIDCYTFIVCTCRIVSNRQTTVTIKFHDCVPNPGANFWEGNPDWSGGKGSGGKPWYGKDGKGGGKGGGEDASAEQKRSRIQHHFTFVNSSLRPYPDVDDSSIQSWVGHGKGACRVGAEKYFSEATLKEHLTSWNTELRKRPEYGMTEVLPAITAGMSVLSNLVSDNCRNR